jgi:hypothetical protein
MSLPLPEAKSMSSAERIAAMQSVRSRINAGADVSEEELRWCIDLLREERSDAARHRKKESAAVKEANIPSTPISTADL